MTRQRKLLIDSGARYGRLVFLRFADKSKKFGVWECDCGSKKKIYVYSVVDGSTKSCGCLKREILKTVNVTHGLSKSPEFFVWNSMILRCTNPNSTSYARYGGRGIAVCARWRKFENFYEDMGPRPSSRHTVERIDNSKGYEMDNCRWATYKEQARNARSNFIVNFKNEKMCLAELSERTGTPYSRLFYRVTHGWSLEDAVNIPAWGG